MSGAGRLLRVAAEAQDDLRQLLEWSGTSYGPGARDDYEELIEQAIMALLANPEVQGSRRRDELSRGVRSFHLRGVLRRTVSDPRHALYFRYDDRTLTLLRVLHERQDPRL